MKTEPRYRLWINGTGLAVLVFSVLALAQGPGKKPQTYTIVKAIRGHVCLDHDPCVPTEAVKAEMNVPYVASTYVITHGDVVIHAYYDAYYDPSYNPYKFGVDPPAGKTEGVTNLAQIPIGVPLKMERERRGLCWKTETIFTVCFEVYAEEVHSGAK